MPVPLFLIGCTWLCTSVSMSERPVSLVIIKITLPDSSYFRHYTLLPFACIEKHSPCIKKSKRNKTEYKQKQMIKQKNKRPGWLYRTHCNVSKWSRGGYSHHEPEAQSLVCPCPDRGANGQSKKIFKKSLTWHIQWSVKHKSHNYHGEMKFIQWEIHFWAFSKSQIL